MRLIKLYIRHFYAIPPSFVRFRHCFIAHINQETKTVIIKKSLIDEKAEDLTCALM